MFPQRRRTIPKPMVFTRNRESSPKPHNSDPSKIEEVLPASNNETKKREYKKGRFLGKGGFAKCYELICKDNNKIFAAKMIAKSSIKSERQNQKLRTEIKIHKSCHNPQIVAFEHNFQDSDNVYILLELCQNQTMNELHIRRKVLTELEVQCYMVQLVKALQYLHSHRIIHRDLKLGNLFLNDKMELKVGDFGLATKLDFEGERKKTICGTPNYIAPEVISGAGHSYEVDIWAVGIIIYTLLVGKPPFETRDVKTTYGKIKKAEFSFPDNCKISKEARNLIKRILVLDPKKRPKLNEILFDDFFNQGIAIPKLMPTSTLAYRPTKEYLNKYIPDKNSVEANNKEIKNESTKELSESVEDGETNDKSNGDIPQFIDSTFLSKKEVWVVKWVDFSSKYGIGYILNNGLIGVYFNDNSKILFNPKENRFTIDERKITDQQELLYTIGYNEYPDSLKKKIFLFHNFKKLLEEENKPNKSNEKKRQSMNKNGMREKHRSKTKGKKEFENNKDNDFNRTVSVSDKFEEIDYIFVKKWLKTKHAIIFRFSNKVIQVCFKDNTQLIIHPLNQKVTYINKAGEKVKYPLNKSLNTPNSEMNKRVKYTKEVLAHMVSLNKKKLQNDKITPEGK